MTIPTDIELNEIGVLKRRAIEARVLAPMLAAMSREFGEERVRAIARDAIVEIARQQGAALAKATGGCSLANLAASLDRWTADDALRLEMLRQDETRLEFNVTQCRYAELYRGLGIPELGVIFSCCRDQALIEGFNSEVVMTRTRTLMEGGESCDFRCQVRSSSSPQGAAP